MKAIGPLLVVIALVGVIAKMPGTSTAADGKAPVFVNEIVPGYRDWRFISVAHEEGQLNDPFRNECTTAITPEVRRRIYWTNVSSNTFVSAGSRPGNYCSHQHAYEGPWTLSCATVIVRANTAPSALTIHAIRSATGRETNRAEFRSNKYQSTMDALSSSGAFSS